MLRGTRGPRAHRPDLLLEPASPAGGLPVAVEVELTVKAPERLAAVCLAWARSRAVSGVLYLAAPEVRVPLGRAIARAGAGERLVVLDLPRSAAESSRRRAEPSHTVRSLEPRWGSTIERSENEKCIPSTGLSSSAA